MSQAKELIIKSKFDEKGKWLDLKFKSLLCCVLDSVLDYNDCAGQSNVERSEIWCDCDLMIRYYLSRKCCCHDDDIVIIIIYRRIFLIMTSHC